jgi:hypothetical protein
MWFYDDASSLTRSDAPRRNAVLDAPRRPDSPQASNQDRVANRKRPKHQTLQVRSAGCFKRPDYKKSQPLRVGMPSSTLRVLVAPNLGVRAVECHESPTPFQTIFPIQATPRPHLLIVVVESSKQSFHNRSAQPPIRPKPKDATMKKNTPTSDPANASIRPNRRASSNSPVKKQSQSTAFWQT